MKPDPSDLDPQRLWQGQDTEYAPVTLAAVHDKARAFQAKVRRRNMFEYAASAFVILGFLPVVFDRTSWIMQLAGALIIAATVFVAWQIHRRASASNVPETGASLAEFHRAELGRQRDAVGSIAVWYLAPFVPGMTLLLLGRWLQGPAPHRSAAAEHGILLLTGAIEALVFVGVWLLNQRAAARLQRELDALRPPQP